MRLVLISTLALAGWGCSFYAPTIADCTVRCGEGGACPADFSCRGVFCRPTSGSASDCSCGAGSTRSCGTDEGECVAGHETCSPAGEWGGCEGAVGPAPEVCDGKDNDCDGLVDLGPARLVIDGETGPYEGVWRLVASDAGYTMVAPRKVADGGAEFHSFYFAPDLTPRGESQAITTGWKRVIPTLDGDDVLVSYFVGAGDAELSRVSRSGQVTRLAYIPDAGVDSRMQLGRGPSGLVSMWVSTDATVRVAKWDLDAGTASLRDLPKLPGGEIYWVDATSDGQFAIIEANADDGGVIDAVHHVDEATPRTVTAPYWMNEPFHTRDGLVTHLDIVTFTQKEVIFYYDYAAQRSQDYFNVEREGNWSNSDFMLDEHQDVVGVYVNDATQRMVFARVEGRTYSDLQATRRVAEDVAFPTAAYSGNVHLARVPGDPMFGVFWSTRTSVYARRFCAP